MPLQLVTYNSSTRLACIGCTPADVILCITASLIAPQNICANDTASPYVFSYIEAQLVASIRLQNKCQGTYYAYTFSIDDSQLVPGTNLTCNHINGVFCKGCLTQWIEDKIGDEITVEELTPGIITITTQHGCTYTFQRGWSTLDLDANNNLVVTYPDGTSELFSLNGTPLVVVDTTTVNLTSSGIIGHTLQADVIVSPTGGNLLSILPNGLFAAAAAQTPITVIDTNSVNLSASGIDNHTLQADVRIDPAANNRVSITGNGLLVPTSAFTHTLTNPGGAIVRLTAPDGSTNDVDICAIVAANCPQQAIALNPDPNFCFAPGPNTSIRNISLTGNTINISAAPEHTTRQIIIAGSVPLFMGNIRPVGVYGSNASTIVINNPSLCRTAVYLLPIIVGGIVNAQDGGRFEYGLQEFDGVNWNFVYQGGYSIVGHQINQLFTMNVPIGGSIAPGGSVTRQFRFAIQTTASMNAGTNVVAAAGVSTTQGLLGTT